MKQLILVMVLILLISPTAFAGNKDRPVKQFQKAVTVTSTAADIMTENLKGVDIFIQNNDAAGIIYINFSGTATVSATMIILNPGDILTAGNTTNSVSAIGSIASNANVAVSIGR